MKEFLKVITCILLPVFAAACTKLCTSGYEGSDCNTLSKAKFLGVWMATIPPTTVAYLDTISSAAGVVDVTISHSFAVYFFAHPINATVNSNTITIPLQQPDSNGNPVQGSGIINAAGNTINWIYQIDTISDTAVWSK